MKKILSIWILFLFGIVFTSFAEGDIILHFDFEEEGSIVKDLSGNGNDGTVYGNPKRVKVKDGKAIKFDGVDDYIEVPFKEMFNTEEVTFEAWIKLTKPDSTMLVGRVYKAPCGITIGTESFNAHMMVEEKESIYFIGSTPNLLARDWSHIIFIYDGKMGKFYLDGELLEEKEVNKHLMFNKLGMIIGTLHPSQPKTFSKGLIGEFKVYNRALNKKETKDAYENTKDRYPKTKVVLKYKVNPLPEISCFESKEEIVMINNDMQVSKGEIDNNGFVLHKVKSEYQIGETHIRVLLPDNLQAGKKYPVLYILPVEPGMDIVFGDGLKEARKANLQNKYGGLICVYPTLSNWPWFADHPTKPEIRQESYILNVVIPFIEKTYPAVQDPQGRLLVGFSKSGWGAFSLLLRHPELFGKAAAWDAPFQGALSYQGSADVFGANENFAKYDIFPLLRKQTGFLKNRPPRLIIMGQGNFKNQHETAHAFMLQLGIPHLYEPGPNVPHGWNSQWLEPLVDLLVNGLKSAGLSLSFQGQG